MIAATVLAALALQSGEGVAPTAPQDFAGMASAFVEICHAPFPSVQGFADALYASPYAFELQRKSRSNAPPGDTWLSGTMTLRYVTAERMPASVPSPQCTVQMTAASTTDHLGLAAELRQSLALERGKSQGRAGDNRTIWDFTDDAGNRLRLFFNSRLVGGGQMDMSLTLVRLRSEIE